MKTVTYFSGITAVKIWLVALLINTIGGSFILAGFRLEFFTYAAIGGFFGAVFSFPVFIAVWISLYILIQKRYRYQEVFIALLFIGIALATMVYYLFSSFYMVEKYLTGSLAVLAVVSGCIGISLCYKSIKNYCVKREEEEVGINPIGETQ